MRLLHAESGLVVCTAHRSWRTPQTFAGLLINQPTVVERLLDRPSRL